MAENITNKCNHNAGQPDTLTYSLNNVNLGKIATTMAHLYVDSVDKHRERLQMCLDKDALLDWFGRTIFGKDEILTFLNTTVPYTMHYIYSASECKPVLHRSKRYKNYNNNNYSDDSNEDTVDEGCVRLTSDNENIANKNNNRNKLSLKRPLTKDKITANPISNLINVLAGINQVTIENVNISKVPKLTPRYGNSTVIVPKSNKSMTNKAIVIKANLYIQAKHKKSIWERKLKHILIEYDSNITLIVYEGASNCRKNLSKLLDKMAE